MDLKNVIPNGNNVVASNKKISTFICLKIVKIKFKIEHYMLFLLKIVMIAEKTKFLRLFTSLINIK